MEAKNRFLQWQMVLILLMNGLWALGQTGPYPLTGNESVCLNSTHNYGVTSTTGSTYNWSILPATGGTITGNGSNTISVVWQTAGTYTLEVTETNSSGCSNTIANIQITINSLSVVALTGSSPVCQNSTGNVYTTDSGMSNYVWTVVGGTITSGGTTTSNTVTVTWSGTGSRSVSVNYTNSSGCEATSPTTLPVTVNQLPATSPIYHN